MSQKSQDGGELGCVHIWQFGLIKNQNELWCDCSISAVHLNKRKRCHPNLGAHQTSKSWEKVGFGLLGLLINGSTEI